MESKCLVKTESKLTRFQILFIYFCIYAFIGWIMETIYVSHLKGYLVKRGFLFGPLCPIYGFGAVMLITILGKYKKQPAKLFFYAILIFSIFEYMVSFGLEALYGNRWWDYSTHFFNLNGRITLFSSLIWGVLALLFFNTVHPFIEKKVNSIIAKIPFSSQDLIVNLIFFLYIVDTLFSCVMHLFIKIDYL